MPRDISIFDAKEKWRLACKRTRNRDLLRKAHKACMTESKPPTRKKIRNFSASQIQAFRECRRLWMQKWILGKKEPPTPAQQRGTEIHDILEKYLLTGVLSEDHPLGYHRYIEWLIKSPKITLPDPNEERVMPEYKLFLDTPSGEAVSYYSEAEGVPLVGLIDVGMPDRPVFELGDLKTTTDFKYAKTPAELLEDTQMNTYAVWAFSVDEDLEEIRVTHYYVKVSPAGKPAPKKPRSNKVLEVSTVITRENAEETWKRDIALMEEMKEVALIEDFLDLEPNLNRCSKYGGCEYKEACGIKATDTMFAKIKTKKGTKNVGSFLSKVKAAEKAKAQAEAEEEETPKPRKKSKSRFSKKTLKNQREEEEEEEDEEEEETPKPRKKSKSRFSKKKAPVEDGEDEDEDEEEEEVPKPKRKSKSRFSKKKAPVEDDEDEDENEDEEEEEAPKPKRKSKSRFSKKKKAAPVEDDEDEDEDEEEAPKPKKTRRRRTLTPPDGADRETSEEESEEIRAKAADKLEKKKAAAAKKDTAAPKKTRAPRKKKREFVLYIGCAPAKGSEKNYVMVEDWMAPAIAKLNASVAEETDAIDYRQLPYGEEKVALTNAIVEATKDEENPLPQAMVSLNSGVGREVANLLMPLASDVVIATK